MVADMEEIRFKQFVIVPREPKMSAGKIASQVAHATFMALENQHGYRKIGGEKMIIESWKKNGMCVIVLECKDSLELFGIAKYLEQWDMPHHLYIDEGITEVSMGTPTALATGVLTEDQFWMFSTMKLFGSSNAQDIIDSIDDINETKKHESVEFEKIQCHKCGSVSIISKH